MTKDYKHPLQSQLDKAYGATGNGAQVDAAKEAIKIHNLLAKHIKDKSVGCSAETYKKAIVSGAYKHCPKQWDAFRLRGKSFEK